MSNVPQLEDWPEGAECMVNGTFTKWEDDGEYNFLNGEWVKQKITLRCVEHTMKRESNLPPTKRTPPPPPPPTRTMYNGFFSLRETKESIRAREDYEVYMRGWLDGRHSMKDV